MAVLSLALGIGANTAIFTLVNQLILQLLPVSHPEQLVLLTAARRALRQQYRPQRALLSRCTRISATRTRSSAECSAATGTPSALSFEGRTELVAGELVSGNYFPVLGVGAALGRVFTAPDDLIQGGHPLAVLSYGYWKTRFAGDRGVLGKKIVVNGYPLTIVGVSQAGLRRRGARATRRRFAFP